MTDWEKLRQRLWIGKNLEKIREQKRLNYLRNRESRLEKARQWKAAHPEYIKEYRAKYTEEKREEIRAKGRKRYKELSRVSGYNRKRRLSAKYGITVERFDEILKEQDNRCKVCSDQFNEENRVVVDHCHNAGHIRGLLCNNCNTAEGMIRTPENAYKLWKYMEANGVFYPTNGSSLPGKDLTYKSQYSNRYGL